MIEIDRTDEEREELVKKWIANYWLWVVAAVAIAIGAVYGMSAYNDKQNQAMNEHALKLEAVFVNLEVDNVDAAVADTLSLQQEQPHSTFAALATLAVAQKYARMSDYPQSMQYYDWIRNHSQDLNMRDVAVVRQARVLADSGAYAQAVQRLDELEGTAFQTESALLQVDILMADHRYDEALVVLERVKSNQAISPEFIRQRIDLVTIKKQKAQ